DERRQHLLLLRRVIVDPPAERGATRPHPGEVAVCRRVEVLDERRGDDVAERTGDDDAPWQRPGAWRNWFDLALAEPFARVRVSDAVHAGRRRLGEPRPRVAGSDRRFGHERPLPGPVDL